MKFAHSCFDYSVLDYGSELEVFLHGFARTPVDKFKRHRIIIEGFEPFFLVHDNMIFDGLERNPKIKRIEKDSQYKTDLFGNPVTRLIVRIPKDVSDRRNESGLLQTTFKPETTFLGNILFDENFLIVSGIREGFEIKDFMPSENVYWKKLIPIEIPSLLRRNFIDIEIDNRNYKFSMKQVHKKPKVPITIIGNWDNFHDTLFTLAWHPDIKKKKVKKIKYILPYCKRVIPWKLYLYPDEESLLKNFIKFSNWLDWDQSSGWNVYWDWRYLIARMKYLNLPVYRLSPFREVYISGMVPLIKGRVITDQYIIYQKIQRRIKELPDYRLDQVYKFVCGVGKLEHRGLSVGELWFEDFKKALLYNARDLAGCIEIEEQTGYLNDHEERRRDCGCEWDSIKYPSTLPKFYRYRAAREEGIALPTKSSKKKTRTAAGGMVSEPKVGLHEWVIVLDFKTLYSNIQNMLNISPETRYPYSIKIKSLWFELLHLIDFCGGAPFISENKIFFRRKPDGFNKRVMIRLIKQRDAQKLEMANLEKEFGKNDPRVKSMDAKQKSKKAATHTSTGMLEQEFDILFDPDLFEATTITGQYLTKTVMDYAELDEMIDMIKVRFLMREQIKHDLKIEVVYGDTDSCMIKIKGLNLNRVIEAGNLLQSKLTRMIRLNIEHRYKTEESFWIDLRFETVYRTFFMSFLKDSKSKEGARKCYFGHKIKELTALGWIDRDEVEIKGFSWFKSSASEIANNEMKKIVEMIARLNPMNEVKKYIKKLGRKFSTGEFKPSQYCTPIKINKRLGCYGKEDKRTGKRKGVPPQIRGAIYNNQYLEGDLGAGDKPKWGWVSRVPKGLPPTDVISFYDDEEVENFEFDLRKMWNKVIQSNIEAILKGLGTSWEELIQGRRQDPLW